MGTTTPKELQEGHKSNIGGSNPQSHQVLEDLPPKLAVALESASFQKVGEDDVIGDLAIGLHLFQYVQSLLQVVLVNEALDEHGICNDVWDNTCLLHGLKERQGFLEASTPHEALDQERTHDSIQLFVLLQKQLADLAGHCLIVLRHASIQEGAEGDVVRLQIVLQEASHALEAAKSGPSRPETLHHRVVGDDVHQRLLHPTLPFVGFLQNFEGTLRTAAVDAGKEEEVQHQSGGLGVKLLKELFGILDVPQRHVASEMKYVVLRCNVRLAELRQQRRGAVGHIELESRIDQAGEGDLVCGNQVLKDAVGGKAQLKVTATGEELHSVLPELGRWDEAAAPHGPKHSLGHIDLVDAHGGLHERGK
mmetsp:Transcript_135796/g.321817  ORF Transcript_135796/g.321817 Transcript_135796/m.321817 type:complete len:364 (+) Transcript_135796:471-1562(+)